MQYTIVPVGRASERMNGPLRKAGPTGTAHWHESQRYLRLGGGSHGGEECASAVCGSVGYQIHSPDGNYNLLYSSYAIPLSLSNMGVVLDIANHVQ